MARTKNRGLQQSFSPSYTVRRWRLGAYIRLSKEDLKKGKDDSNSVINQRDLLNDFYQKHIGEFESVSEYVDDGHTGTDANRENFQRLLSDVMSGKINCVVVKDLSRFARNYSDAGSLIDNLFVQMGVRFISLAENVDSYKNPDSVSNIIVPITNVMNEFYARDTSRKIRSVFKSKGMSGKHLTGTVIYGYLWDENREHWLVDEEAAAVVRHIFALAMEGYGPYQIATKLSEEKIEMPAVHLARYGEGVNKNKAFADIYRWSASTVVEILKKQEYLGHTVNFKTRKHFKDKKSHYVDESEWTIFENTHEAIIDQETFDNVQRIRGNARRYHSAKEDEHERIDLHPLRGLLHPRPETFRAAGGPHRQVWPYAATLPEGTPARPLQQLDFERKAVPALVGD